VVTKLDVLDTFDQIFVCVGYRCGQQAISGMPPTVAEIEKLEPVYECVPGWAADTFGISDYDELPARARDYIAFLEQRTGVEIGCISTGPERNQTIVRPGSRFEKLVGCQRG
jgi:adenylosuccinate synthase